MTAMLEDPWPDEYDRKIASMLAYRDALAAKVAGPIPEWGSPEWVEADEQTKLAAFAAHQAAADVQRGREISDRMAADLERRRRQVDVSNAFATGPWSDVAEFVASGGAEGLARRRARPGPLARDCGRDTSATVRRAVRALDEAAAARDGPEASSDQPTRRSRQDRTARADTHTLGR